MGYFGHLVFSHRVKVDPRPVNRLGNDLEHGRAYNLLGCTLPDVLRRRPFAKV